MKKSGCFLILFLLILGSVVLALVQVYGGKFLDRYQRPWAYSTTDPLLIGHWQGTFQDPNGVEKTIDLEIFLPETDDERWRKAGRRRRRRGSNSEKRSFDGAATVTSRLGKEQYEVWGSVDRDDMHQLHLNFRTTNEKTEIRPNFALNVVEAANWHDNRLTISQGFSYRQRSGGSYWSSSDPRFSQKVTFTLSRTQP